MVRIGYLSLTLGVFALVLAVNVTLAADTAAKKGKRRDFAEQLTRLLPEGAEDKLKLTEEQKKQVARVEEKYRDSSKESMSKLRDEFAQKREVIKKARQDKDKAALREALSALRTPVQEVRKVRQEYREKVKAVLNDEQKKTFDETLSSEPTPGGKLGKLLDRKKNK